MNMRNARLHGSHPIYAPKMCWQSVFGNAGLVILVFFLIAKFLGA